MPRRDMITIGGSAGSLEGLRQIVRSLPENLPASVFIVIHLAPRGRSYLSQNLNIVSALPVVDAADGEKIQHGRIYVAPPDRHLLVGNGHIHLTRGPKEGLHRPSINVTFRSAAAAYDGRMIGVLLSGMLDDGAAGMWEIARQHGINIVQDPAEAQFPSMPLNALEDAAVHYRCPVAEIGGLILRLVNGEEMPKTGAGQEIGETRERFSGFTCPECRGPLYISDSGPVEFRCRVGHMQSLKTMFDAHTSTQERKLYEALVALEEGAQLAEFTAVRLNGAHREDLEKEAAQLRRHAEAIRRMIEERVVTSVD